MAFDWLAGDVPFDCRGFANPLVYGATVGVPFKDRPGIMLVDCDDDRRGELNAFCLTFPLGWLRLSPTGTTTASPALWFGDDIVGIQNARLCFPWVVI